MASASITYGRQPGLASAWSAAAARHPLAVAAILLGIAAFALRLATLGDPFAGFDEQLYLLIGERMWQGQLPYVDLWDRKPFGLFGLFWLFSAGGHGLIVSQLAATACAAGTAWLVTVIAHRRAGLLPSLLAGLFYLLTLRILGGKSTQSPVFYNLFVVAAAWLVLRVKDAPLERGAGERAVAAMLLCGLAIEVKTVAALAGAFFGLYLLWTLRRAGLGWPALLARAAGYLLAGLLPTLAVIAFYLSRHQFDAFWYANVTSIFARQQVNGAMGWGTMWRSLGGGGPTFIFASLGLLTRWGERGDRAETGFLAGWLAASFVEFFAIGCYWCHYLLPLTVVGSVLAASGFERLRRPGLVFGIIAAAPVVLSTAVDARSAVLDRAEARALVAAVPAGVNRGCLFMYEGPTLLYNLTGACTVTRFVFTDHLRSSREQGALGVDSSVALRAALAHRPLAIVSARNCDWPLRNLANDAIMARTLHEQYRLTAEVPDPEHPTVFQVWVRREAPAGPPATAHPI